MAARSEGVGYDRLHHFVAAGVWDAEPLEAALLGGEEAFLVVDDTALPKKGRHSVGVAPQYASALGKNANCQTMVSVTLARAEVPVMVGLRLFLPESWTSDPDRLARARVPEGRWAYRTKPENRARRDRPGARRRRTLRLRACRRRLRSERTVPSGPDPARAHLGRGGAPQAEGLPGRRRYDLPRRRPRATAPAPHPRPDLGRGREGAGGPALATGQLEARHQGPARRRFAAMRVRVADGPTQRIHDLGAQHLPCEEVWLLGEHRSTGEKKYYLTNLPADTSLKQLAAAVKARWVCEQAHQQLKEELGLDHFEGRSWTGLHRHALMCMCMVAYAFLPHQRLAQAGQEKKSRRTTTSAKPAGRPTRHHYDPEQATANALPPL